MAAHPLTDPTVLFTKRFASKVEEGRRLSRTSAKQIASPAAVGLDDVAGQRGAAPKSGKKYLWGKFSAAQLAQRRSSNKTSYLSAARSHAEALAGLTTTSLVTHQQMGASGTRTQAALCKTETSSTTISRPPRPLYMMMHFSAAIRSAVYCSPAALSLRVSVQIFSTSSSDRQATALRLTTPRSPTINGSLCAGPPTTIVKNNRKFFTLAVPSSCLLYVLRHVE